MCVIIFYWLQVGVAQLPPPNSLRASSRWLLHLCVRCGVSRKPVREFPGKPKPGKDLNYLKTSVGEGKAAPSLSAFPPLPGSCRHGSAALGRGRRWLSPWLSPNGCQTRREECGAMATSPPAPSESSFTACSQAVPHFKTSV